MNRRKAHLRKQIEGGFFFWNDNRKKCRLNVKKCRSNSSGDIWSVYRMSQNVVDIRM